MKTKRHGKIGINNFIIKNFIRDDFNPEIFFYCSISESQDCHIKIVHNCEELS